INERHENPAYLPGATLSASLRASNDLQSVVRDAPVICSVVPSHVSRQILSSIAPHVAPGTRLICASKGIEIDTLQLMGEVAAEALPQAVFVALSGPSFAEEVHGGCPTAIVAASRNAAAATETQQLFSTKTFRLYSSDDVTGVTLGGSLKNAIAIAAGILDGLGLGHNARAALLTRGLAEIARLGSALGANAATFSGLAGMGDMILTCTGALSRNRQLGMALAGGSTLEEFHAAHNTVVEGVNTARAASRLAERHGVELPITRQVAAVLFEGVAPRVAIQTLMERTLKAER
ncbi:MAG: NAD(P)H-dependent glycerol-3-phosphate dehydrogenase, partial [Gemmatimonadota bacterium]